MKRIMLASLILAVLFSTTGCKKDKDETEASAVSVKFDNNVWNASIHSAVYTSSQDLTAIIASKGLSEQLQIMFKGKSTGTYNLTTDFDAAYCAFVYMSGEFYTSVNENAPVGQIIVTKYDEVNKLISGTFFFEGYNMSNDEVKVFTEGKFTNVKLEIL